MRKTIFIAMLTAAFAFAETEMETLRAEIERLNAQLEIQRLNAEIQSLQQVQSAEIAEIGATEIIEDERNEIVLTEIDTTAETVNAFRKIVLENREWTRNNFVGIGGGLAIGAMFLDTRPIRNYLRELQMIPDRADWENPLKNSNLSQNVGNREPVFLIGGFGHGNFGNGTIAGGGGYGILAQISSNVADTTFVATIAGGYGGFIFGGGWSNRKNALTITTLVGGGGLAVDVSKRHSGSAFDKSNNWKWEDRDNVLTEGSAFFALEPQLAYTLSFMRWFHLGIETSALLMHSRRGFNWTNSYTTINPSVKLRLVFGCI
ncbi:MAG: hypothetical protein FWE23_01140 [Chitinivibrionia bacterium]|jgi:hypothetical protein|nr:hypothetical protein [Chitinivibrionia bacterium]